MDNKKKYLIPTITAILVLAIVTMIGIIYFESRRASKSDRIKTDIEAEMDNYNQYEGPKIPELTQGETLEEIEKDLNIIEFEIEEIETEMEELEKEFEDLS